MLTVNLSGWVGISKTGFLRKWERGKRYQNSLQRTQKAIKSVFTDRNFPKLVETAKGLERSKGIRKSHAPIAWPKSASLPAMGSPSPIICSLLLLKSVGRRRYVQLLYFFRSLLIDYQATLPPPAASQPCAQPLPNIDPRLRFFSSQPPSTPSPPVSPPEALVPLPPRPPPQITRFPSPQPPMAILSTHPPRASVPSSNVGLGHDPTDSESGGSDANELGTFRRRR